ncbi:MAG: restriction endonuclease [Lachnospiraceae bacterium]|nr:restriction endonuclease [Lachnospiraceae bacterium]
MNYTFDKLDQMEGHDFEYAIADLLRHNGYRDVQVTQGSGDYGIDILARRKNVKYAIQCKRYKKPVGVKAVQEAGLGTDFYHCDAAAVITNSSFTKQAQTLAQNTGVRLWDRTFIEELISNYDEEYDKIDPDIAQAFIKESRVKLQPKVSAAQEVSMKAGPKQQKEEKEEKGILLAKGIYAVNGKIRYFNRDHTYRQAKQDQIALLGMCWLMIAMIPCFFIIAPYLFLIALFILGLGVWGLNYCKRIKQALHQYDRLKKENRL